MILKHEHEKNDRRRVLQLDGRLNRGSLRVRLKGGY